MDGRKDNHLRRIKIINIFLVLLFFKLHINILNKTSTPPFHLSEEEQLGFYFFFYQKRAVTIFYLAKSGHWAKSRQLFAFCMTCKLRKVFRFLNNNFPVIFEYNRKNQSTRITAIICEIIKQKRKVQWEDQPTWRMLSFMYFSFLYYRKILKSSPA